MLTDAHRLAREIADLRRNVRSLSTVAALAQSSVEGGPTEVYDDDDVLRQVFGEQADGTYTVIDLNAPPPPVPADPSVVVQPGLLVVTSYGLTADGSEWPLDFAGIEVHVGTSPGFTPSLATKVAEFTRDGGSITLALDEATYYVVLVAVNTSTVTSAPSGEISAAVTPPATGAGGVATYHTADEPIGLTADDDGAIWYDTNAGNLPHRWDGTLLDWVPMPLGPGGLDVALGGGNLLTNSNFIDTADYPQNWGHAELTSENTTTYRSGVALRVTQLSGGTSPWGAGILAVSGETVSDTGLVKPNTDYCFSAWVWHPSASTSFPGISANASNDGVATTVNDFDNTVDGWVRLVCKFTTGPSGLVDLTVATTAEPVVGDYIIIGAVQLEEGNVPSAYSPKADEILPGAIDGTVITGASIRTAAAGTRIELIGPDGPYGELGMLAFYTDQLDWEPGIVWGKYDAAGNYGQLGIQGPYPSAAGDPLQIALTYIEGGDRTLALNADRLTVNGEIVVNTGLRIGGNDQRLLRGFDYGTSSASSDANGQTAVTHDIGQTPVAIFVHPTNAGPTRVSMVQEATLSSTGFTVKHYDLAGNTLANANVPFYWIAVY